MVGLRIRLRSDSEQHFRGFVRSLFEFHMGLDTDNDDPTSRDITPFQMTTFFFELF